MLPNNLLFNDFSDIVICNNQINMLYLPSKSIERLFVWDLYIFLLL